MVDEAGWSKLVIPLFLFELEDCAYVLFDSPAGYVLALSLALLLSSTSRSSVCLQATLGLRGSAAPLEC